MNAAPDVRALIHAVCHPTSNETYIRDQKTLTDLFKEPGQSLFTHTIGNDEWI